MAYMKKVREWKSKQKTVRTEIRKLDGTRLPPLIFLTFSGLKQSGKTTSAGLVYRRIHNLIDAGNLDGGDPLIRVSYRTFAFADPIKLIARTVFKWNGRKDERGRALLQNIGQTGRAYDEDFWVKSWLRTVEPTIRARHRALLVVSDDVRFQNEVDAINRLADKHNALVARCLLVRPGLVSDGHESEQPHKLPPFDFTITNDGTLDDLSAKSLPVAAELVNWMEKQ
jgi:hypothetical protein